MYLTYLQQFQDALEVLASMKAHLEKTLDTRAPDTPEGWGTVWMNYRENGSNLAAVIPHLPTYAQIQYRQIGELKSFLDAVQQTIRELQVEREESYSLGVQRGKEIADRERRGPSFRERATYDREGARAYSIGSTKEFYNY